MARFRFFVPPPRKIWYDWKACPMTMNVILIVIVQFLTKLCPFKVFFFWGGGGCLELFSEHCKQRYIFVYIINNFNTDEYWKLY